MAFDIRPGVDHLSHPLLQLREHGARAESVRGDKYQSRSTRMFTGAAPPSPGVHPSLPLEGGRGDKGRTLVAPRDRSLNVIPPGDGRPSGRWLAIMRLPARDARHLQHSLHVLGPALGRSRGAAGHVWRNGTSAVALSRTRADAWSGAARIGNRCNGSAHGDQVIVDEQVGHSDCRDSCGCGSCSSGSGGSYWPDFCLLLRRRHGAPDRQPVPRDTTGHPLGMVIFDYGDRVPAALGWSRVRPD